MNNQKLSTKLIAAFMVVAAIALVIGVAGIYGVVRLKGHIHQVGAVRLPSLVGLGWVNDGLSGIDGIENTLMSPACTPDRRQELEKDIKELWVEIKKGLDVYDSLPQTKEEEKLWKTYTESVAEWKKNHELYMTLEREYEKLQRENADAAMLKAANDKMTEQMFTGNDKWMEQASESLQKVVDLNAAIGNDYTRQAMADSVRLVWIMTILSIAGIVVALGMGIVVAAAISNPIREIARQLNSGAAETTEASGQVSSSSQTLALGSSQQAASLEETSSSLEEMSSMTKRNAENARHAKELAQDANKSAEKATEDINVMSTAMNAVGQSADQLRAAMSKIEASSGQISQIMKTIDEIAFQTNILSLNAAVEAARAGEAGAGFAVVADEVRSLAHRSAEAAKQTAQMIKESTDSSHQGAVVTEKVSTDLANMGQASQRVRLGLEEIVKKARQVDEVIGEIATAGQEQEQGIAQVNMAVSQMDKVTQSNAASAEETASAAEQLNAQAEELKNVVNRLLRLVDGASGSGSNSQPVAASHRATMDDSGFSQQVKSRTAPRQSRPAPSTASAKGGRPAGIPMDESFHDID